MSDSKSRSVARVATKSSLADQVDDLAYWLTKDPRERIAAVEILRNQMFGGDDAAGSRLNEFVGLFLDHQVRFLIVGGYALAAHGLPRLTGDLDAWVWISDENASRVIRALTDFGFGSLGLTADDFNRPDSIVQLGYPPYRIDILTEIDGVSFDAVWDRHIEVEIGSRRVPFIGREDLITNKRTSGRPQDIADVARLASQDLT